MSNQNATSENHDRPSHHPAILLIARTIGARPEEMRPALLCAAQFFLILSSLFILRPLRESAGIRGGIQELPGLFLATMVAMLLVNPLFALFVASTRRDRFIPWTYLFFAINTGVFALLFATVSGERAHALDQAFYIWFSVFNLFAVSIFWALMVDLWGRTRGRRLFGFLGVGGTLGAIAGSAITNSLISVVQPWVLFTMAAAGLIMAGGVAFVLVRSATRETPLRTGSSVDADRVLQAGEEPGKATLRGIFLLLRSPYLLTIALYVLLFAVMNTVLYFLQMAVVDANYPDDEDPTAFFSLLSLVGQTATLLIQLFLTGRLIRWLGVGWSLAVLPLFMTIGLLVLGVTIERGGEAALASAQVLWIVFGVQVLRRALNQALAKPSRELLFTLTSQQEKYGSKPIIDTFVYRAGDAGGSLGFGALGAGFTKPFAFAGMSLGAGLIALWMTPLAGLWLIIGLALGVAHRARANQESESTTAPDSREPL